MGCVYCATNLKNGKKYIGKTVLSLRRRRKGHENDAKRGSALPFHRALRRHGFDVFEWDVLFTDRDESSLFRREQDEIALHKTKTPQGYNLTDGGDGLVGFKRTKKHCRNISKGVKRAWQSPELRRRHSEIVTKRLASPEARVQLSKARKGQIVTTETREKISKALTGRSMRDDVRKQISQTLTGRPKTPEHVAKVAASNKGKSRSYVGERNRKNTGKTYEELYGTEKAAQMKETKRRQMQTRRRSTTGQLTKV